MLLIPVCHVERRWLGLARRRRKMRGKTVFPVAFILRLRRQRLPKLSHGGGENAAATDADLPRFGRRHFSVDNRFLTRRLGRVTRPAADEGRRVSDYKMQVFRLDSIKSE